MCKLYEYLLVVGVVAVALGIGSPALAVSPPTITVGSLNNTSASFTTQQTVSMSASSGSIYYTTDGSNPTTSSTLYSGTPFTVGTSTQVNAVAYLSGTYSSITTIYLDINPALAPILQTGLILRLRSTFGLVTTGVGSPSTIAQWADLSGAGNTATGTLGSQPTVASTTGCNQVVSFNGSSQYLSLPSGFANFTSGGSFFLVVQPNSPSTGSRFFDLGNGTAGNNIFMSEPSTSGADLHVYHGSTDSSVSSSTAITVGQFQLLEGSYNGTNTATIYTNGAQDAQSTSMQTANNATRSNNFIGQASGTGNYYSGSIAEILIYSNTTLTTTQQTAIEAYLMQKYQTLSVVPPAPIISVPGGTLTLPTQVAVSSPAGTTTYITTDGTTPTNSSQVYNVPINIYYSQTLKAICVSNGVSSSVASSTYTLDSTLFPTPSSGDTTAPTINLQLPVPSL